MSTRPAWCSAGSGSRSTAGTRHPISIESPGVMPDSRAPEDIVAALVTGGVRVRGFEVVGASLEQRFVELTGEGFDVVL